MAAVRAILSTLSGLAQVRPALGAPRGWRPAATGPVMAQSLPCEGAYAHAGPEPLLEDLLSDPLIRLIMRADHVEPAELRRLLGLRPQPSVI